MSEKACAVLHLDGSGGLAISTCDSRGTDTHGIAVSGASINLADVLVWMEHERIDQLWLTPPALAAIESASPMWCQRAPAWAQSRGFLSMSTELDGWSTFTHPGVWGTRSIVLQQPARAFAGASPLALARALYAFGHATGEAFYRTPGTTGLSILRDTLAQGVDLRPVEQWPDMALDGALESVFEWAAQLREPIPDGAYIRAYDRNAQFLAAAGVVSLGSGAWRHVTAAEYARLSEARENGHKRVSPQPMAGYYLVRPNGGPRALPDFYHPTGSERKRRKDTAPDGWVWVAAPSFALGCQYGLIGGMAEAYVWASDGHYLDGWYRRLRDARTRLMLDDEGAALAVLKRTYSTTISVLALRAKITEWRDNGASDALLRPDWRHHILSMARANLYRKLLQMVAGGTTLLGCHVDEVYTLASEQYAPHPSGVELGQALGQWKFRQVPAARVRGLGALASPDARTRRAALAAIRETIASEGEGAW